MKSMASVIGAVASVLLIGAGAVLHYLTPPDLDGQFHTAISTVRKMQQLGVEWAVETARVRADPSANFDGLAAFVPRMKDMKQEFSETLAQIPELSERVAADSRAYVAAMESLRERVERFKTAYAVIRNSERYLPLASADLIGRAQRADDGELAREVSSLTQELSAFLATPNEPDKERLSGHIQELQDRGKSKTAAVASAISGFAAHAEVLLNKQGRADELFQGITSNPLSQRADPLSASLEAEHLQHQQVTAMFQQGMIAAGAGVLVVWIVVGFTRRSPRASRATVPAVEAPPPEVSVSQEPALTGSPHVEALSPAVDAPGVADAAARAERAGEDLIVDLLRTGALAGLMGQSIGAYTRRMAEDLNAVRSSTASIQSQQQAGDVAQRWRRLIGDTRRLGFFAQRMTVLARHLAPKDRTRIDLNQCLNEVLNDAGAGSSCAVECRFEFVPELQASKTEIRLILATCIDYALHALADMDSAEAKLEVSTAATDEGVAISFTHNGGWLPPEQRKNQFVPFYASQDQKVGIELPAALYLARKHGGTVSIDTLADERTVVHVQLPAGT